MVKVAGSVAKCTYLAYAGIASTRGSLVDSTPPAPAGGMPDTGYRSAGRPLGNGMGPLALSSPAFRRLFKGSANAMLIVDDSRRYLAANEAATRLFGLPAEEIVKRRL